MCGRLDEGLKVADRLITHAEKFGRKTHCERGSFRRHKENYTAAISEPSKPRSSPGMILGKSPTVEVDWISVKDAAQAPRSARDRSKLRRKSPSVVGP